ncbi:hypothetical protein [Mucilaginibacter sp. OK283]|jgi:hypothetical protein|uniref:hypothetical protein n=1 Tax=Mucilaginibacter sp. OK283 TaxID=1881049 RepID=UPI0008AD7A59|nr:hypothetical protein [Mucilaginibacter sp. OK283]SEP41541.1 hypothetical protein SAMN05428947_11597 [Mucilaginibacter sp. OK283]
MKNKNLRGLMATKLAENNAKPAEVSILNQDELIYAMGGNVSSSCPNLTSCGTYDSCTDKCFADNVKVGI